MSMALVGAMLSLASGSSVVAGGENANVDNADPVLSLNQPLRALARPHDLRIGTAVDTDALAADATYNRSSASSSPPSPRRT